MQNVLEALPIMDLVFKALVTKNKEFLQGLLQGTLSDLPPDELENPQILNPARMISYYDEKAAVVDVKLKTVTLKLVTLEKQRFWKKYLPNRTVYHLADMVLSQIKKGDSSYHLEDSIVIMICDFEWDTSLEGYHHIVKLRYKNGQAFMDKVSVHLLELPKLGNTPDGSLLWHYLKFIQIRTKEEFDMLPLDIPGIEKAWEDLQRINADEELREILRMKDMAMRDQNSEVVFEVDAAVEAKEIEVIRNSLLAGLPTDTICTITGASLYKIESVRKTLS